jgi:sugar phosphate isomerase/epimerase
MGVKTLITIILLSLTLPIAYRLGKRKSLQNLDVLMEELAELQDHLDDVKELGFESIERTLELDLMPALNDLKKLLAENDLSSLDDNATRQTPNTESREE